MRFRVLLLITTLCVLLINARNERSMLGGAAKSTRSEGTMQPSLNLGAAASEAAKPSKTERIKNLAKQFRENKGGKGNGDSEASLKQKKDDKSANNTPLLIVGITIVVTVILVAIGILIYFLKSNQSTNPQSPNANPQQFSQRSPSLQFEELDL